MSDTTTSPRDEEIEKQVYDITQKMLVALSEWQAGVPLNYEGVKKQGRAELVHLIKQYGIQERIDEVSGIPLQHGRHTTIRYVGEGKVQSIKDRYAELIALKATTNQLPNDVKEGK